MVSTFYGKRFRITHRIQKIYMFASHKHQDHFDMDILRWVKNIPMYIIFYPRISHQSAFSAKAWNWPWCAEKSGVCLRKQPLWSGWSKDPDPFCLPMQEWHFMWMCVGWYLPCRRFKRLEDGTCGRTYKRQTGTLSGTRSVSLRTSRSICVCPDGSAAGAKYQTLGIDFCAEKTPMQNLFSRCICGRIILQSGEYKKHITNLGMADRVSEIERENQVFPFRGTLTLEFTEKIHIYN